MKNLAPGGRRSLRKFPKVSSLPSFVVHQAEDLTNEKIEPLKTCPELSEIHIDTPPGSPYCRRIPLSERERPRYKSKHAK